MKIMNKIDYFGEINTVMNFFALVDQCQNLASNGYSLVFSMDAMPKIEKVIKDELRNPESIQLFEDLEKIFFPTRVTKAGGSE